VHVADSRQQVSADGTLEQVSGRACRQRVEDILRVLVSRQHDDLDLGRELFQAPGAFHSVHYGQVNVHQNDVRTLVWDGFQGGLGIRVLGKALESRRSTDDSSQSAAQLIIVFHDGNGDGHNFFTGCR
jgi:hypothetical protein